MPKPRGNKKLKVKHKLWVYTEGEKTEQIYLKGYIADRHANKYRVEGVFVEDVKQNTAESLIKRIKCDMNTPDHKKGDIYWVAYDRESVQKYKAEIHQRALVSAKDANINVAMSNVCIEQYLLWHFTSSQASYTSYDNLIAKSNLKSYMASIGIPKYEKGDPLLYEKLKDKVSIARNNAKAINESVIQVSQHGERTPLHELSPYSNFNDILSAIDEFVDKNK